MQRSAFHLFREQFGVADIARLVDIPLSFRYLSVEKDCRRKYDRTGVNAYQYLEVYNETLFQDDRGDPVRVLHQNRYRLL